MIFFCSTASTRNIFTREVHKFLQIIQESRGHRVISSATHEPRRQWSWIQKFEHSIHLTPDTLVSRVIWAKFYPTWLLTVSSDFFSPDDILFKCLIPSRRNKTRSCLESLDIRITYRVASHFKKNWLRFGSTGLPWYDQKNIYLHANAHKGFWSCYIDEHW